MIGIKKAVAAASKVATAANVDSACFFVVGDFGLSATKLHKTLVFSVKMWLYLVKQLITQIHYPCIELC